MNTTDNILEELDVLIEDSLRNSNPIGVTLCYARSTIANYRARIAEFWDALETVREQRDEAQEALAAEIKHHAETTAKWNGHHMDLTIAQCDLNEALRERDEAREDAAHWKAQCRKGFNIPEMIRELAEARGQRDRLAEALKECREDSISLISFQRKEGYHKSIIFTEKNINNATESLQSLTPNEL